jgi:hypothetical protein
VNPVDAVSVISKPVAYGVGFIVAMLIVYTGSWARGVTNVAHEGGHMIMFALTGRGTDYFYLEDNTGSAATIPQNKRPYSGYSLPDLASILAGYPMPCLLGLGGAMVIRNGHPWSVLWAGLFLVLLAFFKTRATASEGPLAFAVTLLAFLAIGWVAVGGTPYLQAAVAVGLVWWMLIGGAVDSASVFRGTTTSDASKLGELTVLPAKFWDTLFALFGIFALLVGGRYLLRG